MSDKNLVLELFGLEDDDVLSADYINHNGNALIDIFLMPQYPPCPTCGCEKPKVKCYVIKKINHSILSDRKCTLNYHARRYKCPVCNKTYYEHNPFVFGSSKISALTVLNVVKDLKNYNETFSSVAKRYYLSPTTVQSIFDKYVYMARNTLPEYLCIDECYSFKHRGENSKYVCMILDFKSQSPVDLLPSRRKEYLLNYFRSIPIEERKKVKMCSSDMWETYRDVFKTIFPSALHCVDHYHLSQELSRVVDSIRIQVMKSYPKLTKEKKISDEYYLLKNFNWLLLKRYDSKDKDGTYIFDPSRKMSFNRHFNQYLNYFQIHNKILAIDPKLEYACNLWDDFVSLYENNSYDTINDSLNKLIESYSATGIKEINGFIRTLKSWKQEIINSLIVIDYKYQVIKDTGEVAISTAKLNNGLMENRNAILKCIKKNSNGYSNWDRFRNRCLYVLRKDAVSLLNPITNDKAKK